MSTPPSLTGYASVFNHPYPVSHYEETIAPGAFTQTLNNRARVVLLANHTGLPLAHTDNGSLKLTQDNIGLRFDATLDPHDSDAMTVHRKVKTGLLNECSFAFQAVRQDWNDDYSKRLIREANIHKGDVAIVNFGASDATSVKADGQADAPMLSTNAHYDITVEERIERIKAAGATVRIRESRGLSAVGGPEWPDLSFDAPAHQVVDLRAMALARNGVESARARARLARAVATVRQSESKSSRSATQDARRRLAGLRWR